MRGTIAGLLALLATVGGSAASEERAAAETSTAAESAATVESAEAEEGASPRQLLWGDTHLHTSYSFDAFLNGNRSADPDVAYRWAKGEPVIHPWHRARVRIGTPLDFLVVSDHAEFLGGIRDIYTDGVQVEDPGFLERIAFWWAEYRIRDAIDSGEGPEYFADVLPVSEDPREAAKGWAERAAGSAAPGGAASKHNAWQRITTIADAHDDPGTFTALIGWEWSSVPGGANLHRVVLTDADGATARTFEPYGSDASPFPEDLWAFLDATRSETGAQFVAIPHNSNISKGLMFAETSLRGQPVDADYARRRLEWERIVEVTQIKGDSETHPALSPDDPFADFELYPYYIQQQPEPYVPRPGDYVRSGLRTGLELEARIGVNPFRFGLIGSTDSHTGLASAEEPNFWGKMAADSIPENKRDRSIAGGPTGWTMAAQGLAAVWAEANTREAIVEAFRRRETYATTGPRIRVELFAGADLVAADAVAPAAELRTRAVPMGGELAPSADGNAPAFVIRAARDPASATLDRIQVVKGWVDASGESRERVFDVVWAGDRVPAADGRVPKLASTVDPATGTWNDDSGAAELAAHWVDPTFDPRRPAFYYVRVLEIPTPRHAQLDAIALGLEAPTEGPSTLQERAYTSPIWYAP